MIENAPPQQRAIANTAGVIAMVLGGILGAGLMLELNAHFSWSISVLSVSSLILVLSIPAWILTWGAAKRSDASVGFRFEPVALWKRFFVRPNIGWMVCAILCFGVTAGADALVPAILVDKGYSPAAAGWLLGTVATATVIPASAIVGAALRRFSVLGVAAVVYAVKAVVLVALAASVSMAPQIVAGLSVLDFCLSGALTVVIWQLYMNFSSREHSASDYSVTTSFDAAIRFAGALLAGAIGQRLGYPVIFGLAGLAAVLSCILCLPLRRTLQSDVHTLGQEA
jgi:cyanate permease